MKYLCQQEKTKDLLSKWAGDAPLVIASFFFWYPGTPMQKSQNGLLRSILHQIISQQPLLTPFAFPEAWIHFSENLGEILEMSRGELVQAVTRILSQNVFELKICLFIDGLDEYDGDHSEIVALFKHVAASPSTKICVSARQWVTFKNSFADYPTLKLQDLTKGDMAKYVEEMLGASKQMAELKEREHEEAILLVQSISEKSSGVFLWVTLVVRSLLSGLLNNDHISDLERRLEELPNDLEELYLYMLKRIDPFYLHQAIRLFRIVQQAHRPLPSLVVAVADDYDFSIPLSSDIRLIAETDVASRCREIEDKLQSRCLGLLECVKRTHENSTFSASDDYILDSLMYVAGFENWHMTVQYMHRTVSDFLEKSEVWAELLGSLKDDNNLYDAHEALLFSSLFQLKHVFSPARYGGWGSAYRPFAALVKECMSYAAKVERLMAKPVTILIEELDRTSTVHFNRAMKRARVSGAKTWVHVILSNEPAACQQQTMFLALAIEYGLERYLSEEMSQIQSCLSPDQLQYLLNFALRSKAKNPRILKLLLASGADPNAGEQGLTPWQQVLKYAWRLIHFTKKITTKINVEQNQLQDILEYFICHNAAPDALVPIPTDTSQPDSKQLIPAITIIAIVGSTRVLGILLDRGADPNETYEQSAPWQQYLTYACQELPKLIDDRAENAEGRIQEWIKKSTLLLEYGADPRCFATIDPEGYHASRRRYVSILTVINEVFSRWDVQGATELQARLPKGLAVELRQIQAKQVIPSPPVSPTYSVKSNEMLSPEDALPLRETHRKRRSLRNLFSAFL